MRNQTHLKGGGVSLWLLTAPTWRNLTDTHIHSKLTFIFKNCKSKWILWNYQRIWNVRWILHWRESRIGDGVKANKPAEDPWLGLCQNQVWTTRKCALVTGISNCTLPFYLAVRQPQECKFMLFWVWGKVRELSLPAAILITAFVPGRDSSGTDATSLPSQQNGLGCVSGKAKGHLQMTISA